MESGGERSAVRRQLEEAKAERESIRHRITEMYRWLQAEDSKILSLWKRLKRLEKEQCDFCCRWGAIQGVIDERNKLRMTAAGGVRAGINHDCEEFEISYCPVCGKEV